ncbi:hypothetical protein [Flavobacterium oncorhynchi]|uniref:hypothetical protein n=1 Tax=Flavobacterium TaxID=237 RepID=UPI00351AAF97
MTAEEKTEFKKMEHSVSQIEKDVAVIKSAILGNPLSGEKGLAGRIDVLNAKQEILEQRIETLTEEKVKNTVYIKIITWLSAVIGAGIFGLMFNYLKK